MLLPPICLYGVDRDKNALDNFCGSKCLRLLSVNVTTAAKFLPNIRAVNTGKHGRK
jgi:hypothetical protein